MASDGTRLKRASSLRACRVAPHIVAARSCAPSLQLFTATGVLKGHSRPPTQRLDWVPARGGGCCRLEMPGSDMTDTQRLAIRRCSRSGRHTRRPAVAPAGAGGRGGSDGEHGIGRGAGLPRWLSGRLQGRALRQPRRRAPIGGASRNPWCPGAGYDLRRSTVAPVCRAALHAWRNTSRDERGLSVSECMDAGPSSPGNDFPFSCGSTAAGFPTARRPCRSIAATGWPRREWSSSRLPTVSGL